MPQKHSKSQSRKNHFNSYKSSGKYASNKRKKLEAHLRKYPGDEKAEEALKTISQTPKRKTPSTKMWSSQKMKIARLYKKVGLNGHHALDNEKVSAKIDGEHLRFYEEFKEGTKAKKGKSEK